MSFQMRISPGTSYFGVLSKQTRLVRVVGGLGDEATQQFPLPLYYLHHAPIQYTFYVTSFMDPHFFLDFSYLLSLMALQGFMVITFKSSQYKSTRSLKIYQQRVGC